MPVRALKSIARGALHSLGIVHAVRAFKRSGCRILGYHRFPEDRSHLTAQCEHIRRYYHPVSMRRVAESLGTRAPLPHNALAITVDDGYRDFLSNAKPIFSRYEIPTTLFVVTDVIDRKRWFWFDQVEYIFDRTHCTSIEFEGRHFAIGRDRRRAAHGLKELIKRQPDAELLTILGTLQRRLGVDLPVHAPAEYEPLSWDEVRSLAADRVEFGSHTRTHPILSNISSIAEVHEEIAGSKKRLDEELGCPTIHFCYPYGTWADFSRETIAVIKSSGFASAVTAESGFNYAGSDLFQLLRLGVEPDLPERRFVELLAGLRKY
jgi:peptidoglycan/xylan/chitin deacetylase (PgdA/CDA1 family)